MAEPARGDARKRTLIIDGPTRLIRLNEDQNQGSRRFKGTRVTLHLLRGGSSSPNAAPPRSEDIEVYLRSVCEDLPYRIHFEHGAGDQTTETWINPKPLRVELPVQLDPYSIRIQVGSEEHGLEGETVVVNPYRAEMAEAEAFKRSPVVADEESAQFARSYGGRHRRQPQWSPDSALLRGGFRIGDVPGIPKSFLV